MLICASDGSSSENQDGPCAESKKSALLFAGKLHGHYVPRMLLDLDHGQRPFSVSLFFLMQSRWWPKIKKDDDDELG